MAGARSIAERLSKLPPGRHLLPKDFVAQSQRARILIAITELAAERGYQNTTIEMVAKSARVALSTFYEHFPSKERCFIAAFDADVEAAAKIYDEVLDPTSLPWPDQIALSLEILVELVIAEPTRARLCFVASQSAGAAAFARYQETVEAIAPKLREGRALSPTTTKMPDGLEVALVGGIAWLVHQRLIKDEAEELRELLPEMVQLTLTPYIGEDEARRAATAATKRERVVLPDEQGGGAPEE
jgi:AcrR family transcriptional regulator